MSDLRQHSSTSNWFRFILKNSATGQGLTGLDNNTAGLIISTINDNEATPTIYTVAAGNIETITTLGTFAAPSTNKCRFKAVDNTNHKGLYEFQFADARFAIANAKRFVISVTGAANLLDTDYEVQLTAINIYDAIRLGLTALPNALPAQAGGLATVDANNRIAGIQGTTNNLNNLDATVSSRLASASYTAPDNASIASILSSVGVIAGYLDTEITTLLSLANAIKAKTDNLPADPADQSDIANALGIIDDFIDTEVAQIITLLGTVTGYVDTEVATIVTQATAIKALTDRLAAMLTGTSPDKWTVGSLTNAPGGSGTGGGGPEIS